MSGVEDGLRRRLTEEEFRLAVEILGLPPSRVRGFLEEKVEEALSRED